MNDGRKPEVEAFGQENASLRRISIPLLPRPPKNAVASSRPDPPLDRGSTWKCAVAAAAPKKAKYQSTREKNVIFLQQNCALHRWRQPLRHRKDARFRHRLQTVAQGIPESRDAAARVLLHRDH